MRWLGGISDLMDMNFSKLRELVMDGEVCCSTRGCKESDMTEQLNCTGLRTLMLGNIEGRMRRGDRGLDGWMVSTTQWTGICANSRR